MITNVQHGGVQMRICKILSVALIATATSLVAADSQSSSPNPSQNKADSRGARGVQGDDSAQDQNARGQNVRDDGSSRNNMGRGYGCGRGCGCGGHYGNSSERHGGYYGQNDNLQPARQVQQTARTDVLNRLNANTQYGQNQNQQQNQQQTALSDQQSDEQGFRGNQQQVLADDQQDQPAAVRSEPDRILAEKVTSALQSDSTLSPSASRVQVIADAEEGKVTLTGTVATASEKTQIESITRRVDGVRSVFNNLTIK